MQSNYEYLPKFGQLSDIALRWSAGLARIRCYRHIAPLEQRPTSYRFLKRSKYSQRYPHQGSPHANGVILLRSENRSRT